MYSKKPQKIRTQHPKIYFTSYYLPTVKKNKPKSNITSKKCTE